MEEKGRPWMILDRQVEGRRGAGAATATSMSLRVVMVGRGEGELADIDWEQAWLEQRVISVDDYEAALAAYAARAAIPSDGHRFTVAVKAPPRITFLTTGISYPNPPAKPDRNPIIVATGPFCLLVQFSAVPPRDPARFYYFNPPLGHLVVVRGFFGGADGRVGGDAVLVPDRGDNIPKRVARDVDTVGFLCDDKDGSYVIAELKVDSAADSSQNAVLICYRSVLGAWSTKRMEAPLPPHETEVDGDRTLVRNWAPHGAVSLGSAITWYDLSWGLLSLDFNLQESEFRLDFSSLPPGRDREMRPGERTADIHGRRCITASDNLLRFVEIIIAEADVEAPTVWMWRRQRQAGVNGWEWALDFEVSFADIWTSDSYVQTGLPRDTPRLACVNPVDSNVVYFTIGTEEFIFGVHLRERLVVHCNHIGRALGHPSINRRPFLTWRLGNNTWLFDEDDGPQPENKGVHEEESEMQRH